MKLKPKNTLLDHFAKLTNGHSSEATLRMSHPPRNAPQDRLRRVLMRVPLRLTSARGRIALRRSNL